MPIRVCKKCGNTLTSSSNYFCSSCGDVLDTNACTEPHIPGKSVLYYDINESYYGELSKYVGNRFGVISKVFPIKYLVILVVVLFVVGGYGLLSNYSDVFRKFISPSGILNNDSCNGDFKCGSFGSDNITSVIPENVSLYVEGFDFNKFAQLIMDFEPSYSYIFDELSHLDSSHFVVFAETNGNNTTWTLVLASSNSPSNNLISLINNPQGLYIGRLSNFYVISMRNNVIADMQLVEGGINKSISQNTNYAIAKNTYPKGQFLIVSTGSDSENLLNQIQSQDKVPGYLRNIATQFLNKKGNHLVL